MDVRDTANRVVHTIPNVFECTVAARPINPELALSIISSCEVVRYCLTRVISLRRQLGSTDLYTRFACNSTVIIRFNINFFFYNFLTTIFLTI
jgi:hypothetical protein